MIDFKKQTKLLFIPIVNCSIIIIIFFKNKYYLKNGWQFKLGPYYLLSILFYIPFLFINENILASYYDLFIQLYGFSWIIRLIEFYPFSVIGAGMLLLAQKKLIKSEYKETFLGTKKDGKTGDGSIVLKI